MRCVATCETRYPIAKGMPADSGDGGRAMLTACRMFASEADPGAFATGYNLIEHTLSLYDFI